MPTPDGGDRPSDLRSRIERDPGFTFLQRFASEFPTSSAYVVGGIVRDTFLGATSKDYDFVVRGVPAETLAGFLHRFGTVALVGKNFGVYKFRPQGWPEDAEDIDIALPRTEQATGGGGYQDFDVQVDHTLPVEDDLSRRDLTINAMALDTRTGALVDPFGGKDDLDAKTIRAVRDPRERFREDRSRMLRCLRFAAQLGFDIEPETMRAVQELMPSINEQRAVRKAHEQTTLLHEVEYVTPRETVARELVKSFVADPVWSFDLWDTSGAIRELLPELLAMKGCAQPAAYHSEGDVWTHTRRALAVLESPEYRAEFSDEHRSALVVLGVLLHDVGKPPTQRTPERDGTDRIRFDGHDVAGGTIARAIARRLALAAPFPTHLANGTRNPLHVDPEELGWIIDHHLLLLEDPMKLRNATIEKYFFNANRPGTELQRVTFCDGSASIPHGADAADMAHFRSLRARIRELDALVGERDRLPKAVVDGNAIMTKFRLKPGAQIGVLIEALREEQLARLRRGEVMTPEDAFAFLENQINHSSG